MFSYRHAYHAGAHSDVLKHTTLIAILRHLIEKDAALTVIDTHAGAGLYRLDSDYSAISGDAELGIKKLAQVEDRSKLAPALQDYLHLIDSFNAKGKKTVYPGSPFIVQRLLRKHDRLKLFELHPTDAKTLGANVAQLQEVKQVVVLREDGFGCVPRFLPPPSRRGLLICDPSYEIKTDYARVATLVAEALKRFVTGTYAVWYPLIPRLESHELPRKLKTLTNKAGKPWLDVTLTVRSGKPKREAGEAPERPGLTASGMFIVNPPHTLESALKEALPQVVRLLGQDKHATYSVLTA